MCTLSLVPEQRRRDYVLALEGNVCEASVFVVEPHIGDGVLALHRAYTTMRIRILAA